MGADPRASYEDIIIAVAARARAVGAVGALTPREGVAWRARTGAPKRGCCHAVAESASATS